MNIYSYSNTTIMPNKIKDALKTVKDTLVQDDNPNSPHRVFARMNEGLLGSPDGEPSKPEKKKHKKEHKKDDDSNERSELLSQKSFERLMWGDE